MSKRYTYTVQALCFLQRESSRKLEAFLIWGWKRVLHDCLFSKPPIEMEHTHLLTLVTCWSSVGREFLATVTAPDIRSSGGTQLCCVLKGGFWEFEPLGVENVAGLSSKKQNSSLPSEKFPEISGTQINFPRNTPFSIRFPCDLLLYTLPKTAS